MEKEHREKLQRAYKIMCAHILWRKNRTQQNVYSATEIGEAMEYAAGAILDLVAADEEVELNSSMLNHAEKSLEYWKSECTQQDQITKSTMQMLDQARAEVHRLRAILSRNGIKYKNPKRDKSKEICRL